MGTILANLKSTNAYPIPAPVIEGAAIRWGVRLEDELDRDTMQSAGYNLCKAEILQWLSTAPNISQGGQSYNFSDEQRRQFLQEAQRLRGEFGEEHQKTRFGYKGSRL